jgi:hypothetical protein
LEEEYKGTFDPKTAIEEDTVDFFAFGHPLFDAIIRYCTDQESNNHFEARAARRFLHHPDYAGYEGVQFNYVLSFTGVRTNKRLIPVALDLVGNYDEELSCLLSSLPASEGPAAAPHVPATLSTLQSLEKQGDAIIHQIAERQLEEARQCNARDYSEVQGKLTRLFDYRLRNQQAELEQRQAQLENARQKGQKLILWEGQVRATQGRIRDLERERDEQLAELQKQHEVDLSIELLNAAYVRVL